MSWWTLRGCPHIMSAKFGGFRTPPPPLVSNRQQLPYPPFPPRQHSSAFGLPPLPPSSAIVSICLTPSPPPAADVICGQPLKETDVWWLAGAFKFRPQRNLLNMWRRCIFNNLWLPPNTRGLFSLWTFGRFPWATWELYLLHKSDFLSWTETKYINTM